VADGIVNIDENCPARLRRRFRIFSFTRSGKIFWMRYSWVYVWSCDKVVKLIRLVPLKKCQHNLARPNCLLFSWNDIFSPRCEHVIRMIYVHKSWLITGNNTIKRLSLCSNRTSNMCLAFLIQSTFWESENEWDTHRRKNFRNQSSRLSISLIICFDSPKCCTNNLVVAKGNSSRNWVKSVPNTWRGRLALDWSTHVKSPSVKRVHQFLTWNREYAVEPRTLYNSLWIVLGVALWRRGIWWQSAAPIFPSVQSTDF
jgi:hypothetical protein